MNRNLAIASLAAVGLIGVHARPASAALDTNLIANPGAQADTPVADSSNIILTGWEAAGDDTFATAQLYGQAGYASAPTPSSGDAYFYGGITGSRTTDSYAISQSVSLADLAGLIDAGQAGFEFSGYFGGYEDQIDAATLSATFLAADNSSIGTVSIGDVTPQDRNNLTQLLFRETDGIVPLSARSVNFTLTLTKGALGTYTDASADNLSFIVSAVPEPATAALLAAAMIPALGRRRRRA